MDNKELLFPALNSPQRQSNATGSGRTKVALPPGRSLMDWIRLGNSGVDLSGVNGQLRQVTAAELSMHNCKDDCWIAIGGKVYNITQYCEYHPGGIDEILKGAAVDGTHLFNQVHRWVNYESMLRKCLVGVLIGDVLSQRTTIGNSLSVPQGQATQQLLTVNRPQKSDDIPFSRLDTGQQKPRFDFFQNDKAVKVAIYTRTPGVSEENIVIERPHGHLKMTVHLPDGMMYRLHIVPFKPLLQECSVKAVQTIGKIEVDFLKVNPSEKWLRLGVYLSDHNCLLEDTSSDYIDCIISKVQTVNYNTKLFTISLPEGYYMRIPAGKHVHFRRSVQGTEIVRSYTPLRPLVSQDNNELGSNLHALIKVYPGGALTPVWDELVPGDTLSVSHWTGSFLISRLHGFSQLLLLAAGTGLTPLVSLAQHALLQSYAVTLAFFNRTELDIIWKEELQTLACGSPKFKIVHILSAPSCSWKGLSGHVSSTLLEQLLPAEDRSGCFVAACGPKGFNELVVYLLDAISLPAPQRHIFTG